MFDVNEAGRSLARDVYRGDEIIRLHDNSQMGRVAIPPQRRFSLAGYTSLTQTSNCCGTAAYALGVEDDVQKYLSSVSGNGRSREFEIGVNVLLPEKSYAMPGYVRPKYMREFIMNGNVFHGPVSLPAPGDLLTFWDTPSMDMLCHCAVFLGVDSGCSVIFQQGDVGEDFAMSTVDNYIESEIAEFPSLTLKFYRKV